MTLRYKKIGKIIRLIDSSSCDEIMLETQEIKLFVRRRGADNSSTHEVAAPRLTLQTAAAQAAAATPAVLPTPKVPQSMPAARGERIVLPMVGTFYRAPSPDAPPFVEVGSKVKAGDPLCLIEVMKLFTTVHAEFGGTVREIGVENAQQIELGQVVFVIDPK